MDAWTCRQYDEPQNKLDEAITILDELDCDESKTFENQPIHWQRSQAEQVRLLVMDNLIDELDEAAATISALQPDTCEPAPPAHRASTAASTLKP
jgi:hypothetical protein